MSDKEELNTDDSANDEAPNNGLPNEVLVNTPLKAAHEDLAPESEKVAEENETRDPGEESKSAKQLAEEQKDDEDD